MRRNKKNFTGEKPIRSDNLHLLTYPTVVHNTVRGLSLKKIDKDYLGYCNKAKSRANNRCEICNRYVFHTELTGDWFRYFSHFKIDFNLRKYVLDDVYAICYECHLYLNPSLAKLDLEQLKINEKQLRIIESKRNNWLNSNGYNRVILYDLNKVYFIEHKGNKFINDIAPQVVDYALSKGVKVVHLPWVSRQYPMDYYWSVDV